MNLRYRTFFITSAVVVFFSFLMSGSASAIGISPLRQTVVVDPGNSSVISISVENTTEDKISVVPEIESFGLDEQGKPYFGLHDDAEKWVTSGQKESSLLPHEKKIFSFQISVPNFAEPGEHLLALYARVNPVGGQIGVATRVGSLVFLHVGGVVDESIVLQEMSVSKKIIFQEPLSALLVLKNVGSIHVVPEGVISVEDRRGNTVERTFINLENKKIFPNTFWKENFSLGKNLHWWQSGPVSIKAVITYGQSKKLLSTEAHVWFFSKIFLFGLSVTFVLFISIVYFVRRSRRKKLV
jgi:hypothetical protein